MRKKVLVLAEGHTEEAFINQVLGPALPRLWLVPTVVRTRVTGPKPEKGGTVSYPRFKRQLNLLLNDTSAALVTTMMDFQGLPADYPGRLQPQAASPSARVAFVEAAMRSDVADARFVPFLTLHEFEALLFVDPASIAAVLRRSALTKRLEEIRARYPATPEDINDSAATSPSARIESVCAEICGSSRVFQKRTHGPIILKRIGIGQIRRQCPHFNDWFSRLEMLSVG